MTLTRAETGWARIEEIDAELWAAMTAERDRQRDKIELIASENYAFAAVMEAAYADAGQTMACNMVEESALEGVQAFIEKRTPNW